MKSPERITIALDKETKELFERLLAETKQSKSGLIRRALRFYSENREVVDKHGTERITTYTDMLAHGEHIILDIDHWYLFLKLIENSKDKDMFWEQHEKVAKSHADQLPSKVHSVEELLKRLEACNFYKLSKTSEHEFTLVLYSEITKRFVREFLQEVLAGMGYRVDIEEDFSKLRVKVLNTAER